MTLAERLRALRTARGWRLREAAPAAGISVPHLSDLERGTTQPGIETLGALARAYGLTTPELIAPVDGMGKRSGQGLPAALLALAADPTYGPLITSDWLTTLARVEHAGRRPRTQDDYLELFLFLRRFL